MILSDNIIENNSLFLRNLDTKSTTKDTWLSTQSSYMFYSANLETPYREDNYYYIRYLYKFTTTNLHPTWVACYIDGWGLKTASLENIVVNSEYTVSGIGTGSAHKREGSTSNLNYIHFYNGPSNLISGVTSYIKNVIVYDVTGLYNVLKGLNIIKSTSELKTWCDSNLEYVNTNVNYDLRDLISLFTKVSFNKGSLIADIVECDGMLMYSVSNYLKNNTYFDNGIGINIYNNNSNGVVTFNRVSAIEQNSPFYPEHPYVLEIKTNGSAIPGCGGFVATHNAAANKIFIEKFVAKIPIGYSVNAAYNSQGTGSSVKFLTSTKGTGQWEEYAILYKCGSSGTFSTGGHVYLLPNSGYSSTSVTWHLAYVNNCDITSAPHLQNYTILQNKDVIKENIIFSKNFDTMNLIENGDGSDSEMILPLGYVWDKTDVTGSAKASIVIPVGNTSEWFGPYPILSDRQYKLSMYVKCKGDMSNYLMSIGYSTDTNFNVLGSINVFYVPGTKTLLTEPLTTGDTQIVVKSNANWINRSYSALGFRSDPYISYNNIGLSGTSSNGIVKDLSGSTIINLNYAYTGKTIPANTYVVESYASNSYYYPFVKNSLPTDNNWKYIEKTFGNINYWDGNTSSEIWKIPHDAKYIWIKLNLYTNDGTVPLKFCDLRLEQTGVYADNRIDKTISFKQFK